MSPQSASDGLQLVVKRGLMESEAGLDENCIKSNKSEPYFLFSHLFFAQIFANFFKFLKNADKIVQIIWYFSINLLSFTKIRSGEIGRQQKVRENIQWLQIFYSHYRGLMLRDNYLP